MSVSDNDLELLLLQAEGQGLVVRTNNRERLRSRLYAVIRRTGASFQLSFGKGKDELLIIPKESTHGTKEP